MIRRFLSRLILGEKRDPHSPSVYHKISLIAIFAWVGIGADGMSSSCYGPEEAFSALGSHPHFSLVLALATVVTVFLISASYRQVIELFPTGGGGYLVASKLLGPRFGMVSGCALLIDYVLTITISIASGMDALFSFLPPEWLPYKLHCASAGILTLIVMNLRGVKESVLPLVPIFGTFVLTHAFLIGYAMITHLGSVGTVAAGLASDFHTSRIELGTWGMLALLLRAYGMGAGTYTGIEAVSNSLPILREPKVETARRTMSYMAWSLSITVFGLMLAYLFYQVSQQPGKTLNAILVERVVEGWPPGFGEAFVRLTLLSEGALLFIAAQTGFFGGPSVLATMAKDRWVPTRFALLSSRLVVQNGILLIGAAALIVLLLTRGSVHFLVVLYSINVFIDFTFSQLGIIRHSLITPMPRRQRVRKLAVTGSGLTLTSVILVSLIALKFNQGGWITLACTGGLIVVVSLIRREYDATKRRLKRLDELVSAVEVSLAQAQASPIAPAPAPTPVTLGPLASIVRPRTAVLLVNGYNGVGLHSLMAIVRMFGGMFRKFVFLQVGEIDVAAFKGVQEVNALKHYAQDEVDKYAQLMRRSGYEAEGVAVSGLDVVEEVMKLMPDLSRTNPGMVVFGGQLIFKNDSWVTRLLHNFTIFDVQRQLYLQGIHCVILPIRV